MNMKNIVLVGFMGTGKTAVAKKLARKLGAKFVSTDDIIEAREKRPITDIFAKDGEPYFRKVEKDVVREVSTMKNVVIAAGGGVVLDSENMRNLKATGVVVCLDATPEEILKRTEMVSHRPLLNVPSPIEKIKELLEKRKPFYAKADHAVDTTGKKIDEVLKEIIDILGIKL